MTMLTSHPTTMQTVAETTRREELLRMAGDVRLARSIDDSYRRRPPRSTARQRTGALLIRLGGYLQGAGSPPTTPAGAEG
jgi:hypothetical protein